MQKEEWEKDDPLELVGVQLPNQTEAQLRDMALCFAEEFIREGWGHDKLLKMFRNPFYQGPYLVWKQTSDDFVKSVIDEAVKMWRPHREEKI